MTVEARHIVRTAAVIVGLVTASLASPAFAERTTIREWLPSSDGYAEFVKLASAEFKKGHPDIDIVVEDFPAEAYKTALQVGLAGANPPDVFFNWAGDDAVRLVRGGRVLDITDLGKQADGFIKQLSPGWLSSFQVDGKYYGVPTDGTSKYFYYNKTFFARNKLTPPTDFDELLGLCSRIRQIDSRDRAAAAGQFRALEAGPLHHHAE